jgi:peptidoglycan LD-endopeptidase LytH
MRRRGGRLGVLKQVRHRRIAAVAGVTVMWLPAGASASPINPFQDDASEDNGDDATDQALVEIDVDVAEAAPSDVSDALTEVQANVAEQLQRLTNAEQAVERAVETLTSIANEVTETELQLEDLTAQMDEVVVSAYITPPAMSALEVLDAETAEDATVTQTMLDMQATEQANVLADHERARRDLEDQMEQQEAAAADADAARAEAEAALADLQAAVDQQTQFVLDVQARIDDPAVANDPELQAQIEALAGQVNSAQEARRAAEEAARLAEQRRNASADIGWIVCPVDGGGLHFVDTWGAARSGGRTHKGTDMMAARGTPTVAPVSGRVVHREASLGGLSWYVYDDNGDFYFGTHLQGYANVGVGWVEAGTVIGYVGTSGNAPENAPHLHFEYHPRGGAAVNPYPLLDTSCPGH